MSAATENPRDRFSGRLSLIADAVTLIGRALVDNPVKRDPLWMRATARIVRIATRARSHR